MQDYLRRRSCHFLGRHSSLPGHRRLNLGVILLLVHGLECSKELNSQFDTIQNIKISFQNWI